MAAPFPTAGQQSAVPTIYSQKLNAKFYKKTVCMEMCNTDWEGDIKDKGSEVKIRTSPDITVNDYTGTVTYEDLAIPEVVLPIDQAKYYAFKDDDILSAQSDIELINSSTNDAAERMKIKVDSDVLGNIYADIPLANQLADPAVGVVGDVDSVLDYILRAGTRLDEENIPEEGRWCVLPPWCWEKLKRSDLKAVHVTGDGTTPLRNGEVGEIDRFKILKSNNVASVGGIEMCMAGTKHFAAFAGQFVKHESLRLESTFGTGHRGLKVYGYKVIKPEAGVLLPFKQA